MRYFMDTEFIDDGERIDLISIGIVCEDGREYYGQSAEFEPAKASEWVREHVLSHLPVCPYCASQRKYSPTIGEMRQHKQGQCSDLCPWRTRKSLLNDLKIFFNPSNGIELWGWCAGYDFVAFCQIFGTMMDVPVGYPHYIRDFQHVLDERDISDDELPSQEEELHNALGDARHLKKLWGYIIRNDCWQ